MTSTRHVADAPAPDAPEKPDSPGDLTKRSWKYVLRKSFREFLDDKCTDLAAALTYYSVLAIFPAMLNSMIALKALGLLLEGIDLGRGGLDETHG